jgi:hypothetical protein
MSEGVSSILINYVIKNVFPYLYDFFMSITFRWFILFAMLVLHIYSYYQNPKLYTNTKKCFKLNCRLITFLIGIFSITLMLLSLITLWYVAPFSDSVPDYWYIPLVILVYAIVVQITISVKLEIEDGSFNPPPEFLINKYHRTIIYVVLLILSLIYFVQLYIDGGVKVIGDNQRYVDHFILGRFGGITKESYIFFVEWFAIIKILAGILTIKSISDFYACDYGLPSSWDY